MATPKRDNRRFAAHSAVYTCGCCGKQTRDTGNDEGQSELCLRCLLTCYVDNSESDYGVDSDEAKQARADLAEYDRKHKAA